MSPHRGNPEDITEAYYRGLMHSVGYRRKDLDKPQIVVVNSWTDVNPDLKEAIGRRRNAKIDEATLSHQGSKRKLKWM
jgi:dihydroxyacid dehydratase/phosphogluconate dehydratase